EIVRRIFGLLWGYLVRRVGRTLAPTRWSVAISRGGTDPREQDGPPFTFLKAPGRLEWTDPFPIRSEDRDLLFVAEYDASIHRGRLVVVELDGSRKGSRKATPILDLATHLSYPFVFAWEGDWYLLPEQASTGRLELYIAESFPERWRHHSTLLDARVSD